MHKSARLKFVDSFRFVFVDEGLLLLNYAIMILVRDVFRLKFGKAKDAKVLMQEAKKMMEAEGFSNYRVMFDLVGPSYTMVWEGTHDSLGGWEKDMKEGMGKSDWRSWYEKFIPLIESSNREIFTILD